MSRLCVVVVDEVVPPPSLLLNAVQDGEGVARLEILARLHLLNRVPNGTKIVNRFKFESNFESYLKYVGEPLSSSLSVPTPWWIPSKELQIDFSPN